MDLSQIIGYLLRKKEVTWISLLTGNAVALTSDLRRLNLLFCALVFSFRLSRQREKLLGYFKFTL